MVLTNAGKMTGMEEGSAGWYLPECAHPYHRFQRAGYKIEFASPLGGATTICTNSIDLTDAENKSFWEDPASQQLTNTTKPLASCNTADYDCVFFVGGFGTMYDFPNNSDVQRLSKEVYEKGGIVGAVCHGPIALINVLLSSGAYLVAGKEVTAFTNAEEEVCGLVPKLPCTTTWAQRARTR